MNHLTPQSQVPSPKIPSLHPTPAPAIMKLAANNPAREASTMKTAPFLPETALAAVLVPVILELSSPAAYGQAVIDVGKRDLQESANILH